MDITAKYIQMCEKAGEIHINYKLGMGDFYYSKLQKIVLVVGQSCFQYRMLKHYTWLPRQDQLQVTVFENGTECPIEQLGEFYDFVYSGRVFFDEDLESWEQLWLAFVMHEKYGKVWDDKKGEWTTPSNEKIP